MPIHRRAYAHSISILGLALAVSLGACDKGSEGEKQAAGEPAAAGSSASADAPAQQAKSFLKDQRKKGCEMLTAAMVAKHFEVPEAELEVMKIAGCIYGWTSADKARVVEASITTIFVKDDAAGARAYFDSATRSLTAAEIEAQLGTAKDIAKQDEAIDSEAKQNAVDQVGGVMAAMIPDAGYQYEDVAGVGDAARVLTHDGSLTVLVGNMVFNVRAYQGDAAPPLDTTKLATAGMDAIMAASKQHEAEWMAKTRDLRKQQGIELAKLIVAAL